MPAPEVVAVGTVRDGLTGSVSHTLPAHMTNDILLLCLETAASTGAPTPANWAIVPGSPRAQGSNVTSASMFWRRATSDAMASPSITSPNNHQIGFTVVIRGASRDSNPWSINAANSANGTAATVPMGANTPVDNCMVCGLFVSSADVDTDQFGGVTNASLRGVTIHQRGRTIQGNGGGLLFASGTRAVAGAAGTFASTLAATQAWAGVFAALKPHEGPVVKRRSEGAWVNAGFVRRREGGLWVPAEVRKKP